MLVGDICFKSRTRGRRGGFTLLEAMILLVIFTIIAMAAGVSLQALAKVPGQNDDVLAIDGAVMDRMEQMKATAVGNFSGLGAQAAALTNTSPGVQINGKYYPCTVTAAQANPDGSGVKTDFCQITVTIGPRSVATWVTQP